MGMIGVFKGVKSNSNGGLFSKVFSFDPLFKSYCDNYHLAGNHDFSKLISLKQLWRA